MGQFQYIADTSISGHVTSGLTMLSVLGLHIVIFFKDIAMYMLGLMIE